MCVWRRHSNPVDVFHKALGIHVCLDDGSEVSANILSWKCQVLKVSRLLPPSP